MMMVLDPKSGGAVLAPVEFIEEFYQNWPS
jgi:hypothetical protein